MNWIWVLFSVCVPVSVFVCVPVLVSVPVPVIDAVDSTVISSRDFIHPKKVPRRSWSQLLHILL